MKHDDLVVVTATLHPEPSVRSKLAIETAWAAQQKGIPFVVVDGGSYPGLLRFLKVAGAHLIAQEQRGTGSAYRQAFREGTRMVNGGGVVVWIEDYKYTFFDVVRQLAAPVLSGEADIAVQDRRPLITYPLAQQLSEPLGNLLVQQLTGIDMDLYSGPGAIGSKAMPFFLDYQSQYRDTWDAILFPVLHAIAAGLKVRNVPVPYVHPPEATEEEEGRPLQVWKRMEQNHELGAAFILEAVRLKLYVPRPDEMPEIRKLVERTLFGKADRR